MQIVMAGLVGLMVSVGAGAEPVVEGWVRLASGEPVAGAQVLVLDLNNLRRYVGAAAEEDGRFVLSLSALTGRAALPDGFGLGQNYPNPFNPGTVIPYQVAVDGHVRLEVFNMLGQRVATLVDGEQAAGAYRARWDARDASGHGVAAGVYIYRLIAGGAMATRQMVLVDGAAGFDKLSPRPEPVEALPDTGAEPVYGLVVFGEGMMAHVDAGFRVGAGPIVVEAHRPGRGKAAQRIRVLGDVDNNGWVDLADALLVMAYSLNASVVMPNGGDIALGDVNGDGAINMVDGRLILLYSTDPSNPTLPPDLGPPRLVEPIEPIEAVEAGLLTIPPITLAVGSSFEYEIRKDISFLNALIGFGEDLSYSAVSSRGHVAVQYSRRLDDFFRPLWIAGLTITGVTPGTAHVTIEGSFGDDQVIPVTVVERPVAIESLRFVEATEEDVLLRIGDRMHSNKITWKAYTDETVSYALARLSLGQYAVLSGLLEEARLTVEESIRNVTSDAFLAALSLVPGFGLSASIISGYEDIKMYISMFDIYVRVEEPSTLAELQGLFAPDGKIIPGNEYGLVLWAKNGDDSFYDADDTDRTVDLKLNIEKTIEVDSESVAIRLTDELDFGPLLVPVDTGYQIIPLSKTVVFDEEAGRDLRLVKLKLSTDFYDDPSYYDVRDKGPALAVEWNQAQKDRFEEPNWLAMTLGLVEPLVLRSTDSFFLASAVRNRSETVGSSPASLSYHCSTEPTISTSNQKLELVEPVEVEALNALGRTVKIVQLPAPRPVPGTGTEVPGTCWVTSRSETVYYGACVSDEVENDENCSPGVPVQLQ